MYQTDRTKQFLLMEGQRFSASEVSSELKKGSAKKGSDFHLELFRFLEDWFDPSEEMIVHSSGSTGKPKPMVVKKKFMMQSACITCDFFGLESNDRILLCMSLNFIAGKMMVVRALVAGLDLYLMDPSGNPLKDTDVSFRFASMVPMQIFNSLQNPVEAERLREIGVLLIGGGVIDAALENALNDFPNAVYASYGMAETLSHIALRRVNGLNASLNFTPLPSVNLSLSEDSALIIDAPLVCEKRIFTNDVAEIKPDGSFRILGRKDNVIVTGGLKVQAETLEATLSTFIHVPFAISSLPDAKFGEIIVLVVEQPINEFGLINMLPSFQVPKKILVVKSIPRTESGKIDRSALKAILL